MNKRKQCIKDTIIYPMGIEPEPMLFGDPMDTGSIVDSLIGYLDLEVDENTNMIIDYITGDPVVIEGRVLIYDDGSSPHIDYKTQVLFNPLVESYKIIKIIFEEYLEKLNDRKGIYFPMNDIEHHKEDNRLKRLNLLDERYHVLYTSRYYYNTALVFIETIYRMNGDYTIFDDVDTCY